MSSSQDQRSPTGEVGRSVADVDPNAPLLLGTAARLAFPDGAVSAATLKRQHRKGLLVIERIGGRDFTTLNAIDEMRRLCRVTPNPPVSVCVVAPDARWCCERPMIFLTSVTATFRPLTRCLGKSPE